MNKNFLYKAYCAAFIGVCAVPAVLMPFFKADSAREKRDLAPAPTIRTEDGSLNFGVFDEFGDWFSDHFAFRSQLVNADGRLKSALFGTSPNSDVIVGTDGWLYYGETADDFLNLNTLSDREISNICHNLRLMKSCCDSIDAQFLFFSAPNKNSVYPENMPANYVPADGENNYAKLSAALSGEDFFLDMRASLLKADASIPLYHRTDTHWNNLGAYAGHAAIMDALGRQCCPAGSWYTKNDRLGDLAAMIYPAEKARDTQVYSDYQFSFDYSPTFRALDDINISTSNPSGEGELLMFRDSYGEAILPYMAECFGSGEFTRAVPYRIEKAKPGGTVVLEIVERNLGNLQKYAPVMCAPVTDISGISGEKLSCTFTLKTEESGKYLHIFGELPEECFSGAEHTIFVTVGDITYEAFSCFEDKLLGREDEHSGNGFSLYIPADTDVSDIAVTVANTDGLTVIIQ